MPNPTVGNPIYAFKRGDRTRYTALVKAINSDGTVEASAYSAGRAPLQVTLQVVAPGAGYGDAEWWCYGDLASAPPVTGPQTIQATGIPSTSRAGTAAADSDSNDLLS